MLKRNARNRLKGQTIVEYSIVLGAIMMIMYGMSVMIKRATQGMVKSVADLVGNQDAADQSFDDSGHLESSYVTTRASLDKRTTERLGSISYIYNDLINTTMNSETNLGFTEEQGN